jgi:hypothetical protein
MSNPIWGSWPDIYYSLTVTVLFLWGALSDETTGLSFVYAAGPRQPSVFRVGVPWDSWPYFNVLDLRLSFSSSPTFRRNTVEVFDPASTRITELWTLAPIVHLIISWPDRVENTVSNSLSVFARGLIAVGTCLFRGRYLVTCLRATIPTKLCGPLKINRRFEGTCRLCSAWYLLHAGFLCVLFFDPELGSFMFLRNIVYFQRTTRRYIPQGRNLYNHRCSWFRHYATSLKVASSIPDAVIGFFQIT